MRYRNYYGTASGAGTVLLLLVLRGTVLVPLRALAQLRWRVESAGLSASQWTAGGL